MPIKKYYKTVKLNIDDVAIISTMVEILYPKNLKDSTSKDSKKAAWRLEDKIKDAEWR